VGDSSLRRGLLDQGRCLSTPEATQLSCSGSCPPGDTQGGEGTGSTGKPDRSEEAEAGGRRHANRPLGD
jgi:hypothetical protein